MNYELNSTSTPAEKFQVQGLIGAFVSSTSLDEVQAKTERKVPEFWGWEPGIHKGVPALFLTDDVESGASYHAIVF